MKCLLCRFTSPDDLFQHHVNFYWIEKTNYYLKTLFERDSNSCLKRTCDVCGETFYRDRKLKNHNFIKHLQIGGRRGQNKPINVLRQDIFTIYSINFEQHSEHYDFLNS